MKRAMLTLTGVLVIGTSAHASIIYQLSTGGRPDSSDLLWRSSMAQLSGEVKVGESESSKGRDPEGDQRAASRSSSVGLLGVSGRLNGNGSGR